MKFIYKIVFIVCIVALLSCSNDNNTELFKLQACNDREAPVEFVEVTEKPLFSSGELMKENAGEYPEMARRAGIEGTFWAGFNVIESGQAENVYIEKGIGGGADETALRSILNSEYISAKKNGAPLCTRMFARVIFNLEEPENVIIYIESELLTD
ncbi:MAG: energy transducer TonB [Balneolaceae bacterium]